MEFGVSKNKEKILIEKMTRLGIREEDIEEKFIRSAKKGGQNVNKTSTCVYLRHRPSGMEVKCQQERSQILNRFLARRRLVNKIEKIKRQKRKRSKRAKEKMLRDKKIRSEKKKSRSYRAGSADII